MTTATCTCKIEDNDQFILDHLGVAKAIAIQIRNTLPVHVELDDLIHAGVLGLLDAAKKYDPGKQVQFSSYARHRIRGAILDSLRQMDTASRDFRRKVKEIETTKCELRATLERDPTEAEIADRMQMDIARLRQILVDAQSLGEFSSCYTSADDDAMLEHQFESKPDTRPDNLFSQVQLRTVLGNAMTRLRPRQRQVLQSYYSEHKTMKEIGVCMGINESRVSQLHKSALVTMRTALASKGVESPAAF